MDKASDRKLEVFADLTLTHLDQPLHVSADGQRITLSSHSVGHIYKLYHAAGAFHSKIERADEYLRAQKIRVYVMMGYISLPLLGDGAWKWLRRLIQRFGRSRR